jgi:hypothetical protein
MFDMVPKNYDDAAEWFRYFRFTKHLPGMQMKFDAQMKRAPTAQAARIVLTTYASAALDVVFSCGFRQKPELSVELEETFGLKPAQMLLLSVDDIVKPLKVTKEELTDRLTTGGFRISANGIITGFERPSEAAKLRPARNRAPGFN